MRLLSMLLAVGLVSMMAAGCMSKREDPPQIEPADIQPSPVAKVATPAVTVETPGADRAGAPRAVAADGSQAYTVQKGDTLYSLARKFYGDIKFRNKILDANAAKIKDPNVLPVGAVLTIPK
jgi:nucleoid-associated protein YgaU